MMSNQDARTWPVDPTATRPQITPHETRERRDEQEDGTMTTLDELRAERTEMRREMERASWQDYRLPSGYWARYQEVVAEIARLEVDASNRELTGR
jgi:cell division protein FtsB